MKTSYLFLLVVVALGWGAGCRKTVEVAIDCPPLSREATPVAVVKNLSGYIPNLSVQAKGNRAEFVMTGVYDPVAKAFIELKGSTQAGQNLWIDEDGSPRGMAVRELDGSTPVPVDIVFVVDVSGSMREESDSVASQMARFTNYLIDRKLDARFGVVGHFGDIRGALNLTTNTALNQFLSRPGNRGTSRTAGFGGPDASTLQSKAVGFHQNVLNNENSIVGLFYADQFFNWRAGASRVYIIFTDDVTHTNGNVTFNNSNFRRVWKPEQGTVHGVFSPDDRYWTGGAAPDTALFMRSPPYSYGPPLHRPWELAQFTGGTVKFVRSDCRDLSLLDLPVTQALTKSYRVEFCTTDPAKPHNLTLTLRLPNGTADGTRTYTALTYRPK